MTLTSRLLAFLLSALAAALVVFSVTLYLLAEWHLDRQVDERGAAALATLAAAVDVGDGFLEWEGRERHLTLGQDNGADQARWTIHGTSGRLVAKSDNLPAAELDPSGALSASTAGKPWRLSQRLLEAPASHTVAAPDAADVPEKHARLLVTVALPLEPQHVLLRYLSLALVGLSVTGLTIAAVAGRWLCRRALAPVTALATAARNMSAADLDARLPHIDAGDELGDLESAFNGLLARLHVALARQQRFTGDASHQLRTPLAAMLGQLEVALRRQRSATEYRDVLGRVFAQAARLKQLVDTLLFLARAEADTPAPELVDVDLAAWLRSHLEQWAQHPRWADIHANIKACRARVHTGLLGQLCDNLLDNACKYSDPGSVVVLTVQPAHDKVEIAVADAGAGIAAEDLPYVFEPFYRSDQARRSGVIGVGLGLAVASRIAAALSGTLRAESTPGYGSRFTLNLPGTLACGLEARESVPNGAKNSIPLAEGLLPK